MSTNCEDSSNQQYQLFWFNYFVSIGYIDNSDLVNLYAPYGKCTRGSLWITYLINLIHFFLLSTGVLYLLTIHHSRSGLWWAFITWISSLLFLLAAVVCYTLLYISIKVFSILVIACQLTALIILSFSIFAVIKVLFVRECRYQRLLFLFVMILLILQIGCFAGQLLITLHCLFNLKFVSISLDYSHFSAILAAIGAIISTILIDYMFVWSLKGEESCRVEPIPIHRQNKIADRPTSPIDPVILDYFRRQPAALSYRIYSNSDQSRHFHILPTSVANSQSTGKQSKPAPAKNAPRKGKIHPLLTSSDA